VNFLGLTLVQYAGALAVAGTFVLALYLLKMRRRRVLVPYSKLWEQVLMDRQATSLFQRLRRILSFLLQLLLVWLLVTALADPRPEALQRRGKDYIVLVDSSASMRSRDVTRRDGRIGEARAWTRRAIERLGPQDRMMVVQMDSQVVPLSPLVGDRLELNQAVTRLRASDTVADFPRALRLALDTLDREREGIIVLLSDGNLGPAQDEQGPVELGDTELRWVKIGRGGRNVGLANLSVRRYPIDRSSCEIFLEINNTGPRDEVVELTLLGDDHEMFVRRLNVAQGQSAQLHLPAQAAATETLEARVTLVGDECNEDRDCGDGNRCAGDRRCLLTDDQPADDRAFALLPERRLVRVLAVSPGNLYLSAALLIDEYLDVTEMTPNDYATWLAATSAQGEADYDVVVFDGVSPPPPPTGHLVYLGLEGEAPPLAPQGNARGGIWFDSTRSRRQHPILRWVSLGDFEVYQAARTRPPASDQIIGRSEDGLPLVVVRRDDNRWITMVTFPLRHSDLPLRMAWPILLMNTLSWYADEDAQFISSYATGQPVHRPLPGGEVGEARLCGPEGCQPLPVHDGELVFVPRRVGLYRLQQGELQSRVAVNLAAPVECEMEPASSVTVSGQSAAAPPVLAARVGGHPWWWLLFVAVIVLLLEWLTYHRRITV
jgi:hypothetical protein